MFQNVPLTDFSIEENRSRFQTAVDAVNQNITKGKYYARAIVNGKELESSDKVKSLDPSNPEECVGQVELATWNIAEKALDTLTAAQSSWQKTTATERAGMLRETARIMLERRDKLSAIIIREAGKPWKEADADVVEAIDFCNYYADEAEKLFVERKTADVVGEDNHYLYRPRGTALVISPWNFPLAILCGMTVASLVTGNTTLIKPAQLTSIIAFEFAKILLEAGIPEEAFALLPASGSSVGSKLVNHPAVDLICFTGSLEVGLDIIKRAAVVEEGQRGIKKVITELGGKNAIIVDDDADHDDAIKGILYSAYGFAGQKCSACSRLIIVGDNYQTLLERLCNAASDLKVGPAVDSSVFFGPLIDDKSQKRVLEYLKQAEKENTLAFKGEAPDSGYYVPAVIFKDVSSDSDIWKRELFAPVIAACKADSFEEALKLANNSPYALTGGIYSRSPEHIKLAREQFEVGNLYINRGCTGAIVCRQPFGGFKMSGIGSKAGGPDYLLQFVEPRTVSENTMRKGMTPELL